MLTATSKKYSEDMPRSRESSSTNPADMSAWNGSGTSAFHAKVVATRNMIERWKGVLKAFGITSAISPAIHECHGPKACTEPDEKARQWHEIGHPG